MRVLCMSVCVCVNVCVCVCVRAYVGNLHNSRKDRHKKPETLSYLLLNHMCMCMLANVFIEQLLEMRINVHYYYYYLS